MDNRKISESFQKALTEYESVIAELNRPKRDVVMIATCDLIKKSVGDFLTAYLLTRNIEVGPEEVKVLYDQCVSQDASFREIELETILCLDGESTVTCQRCLENGWINRCEDIMVDTKELVMKLVHQRKN